LSEILSRWNPRAAANVIDATATEYMEKEARYRAIFLEMLDGTAKIALKGWDK